MRRIEDAIPGVVVLCLINFTMATLLDFGTNSYKTIKSENIQISLHVNNNSHSKEHLKK